MVGPKRFNQLVLVAALAAVATSASAFLGGPIGDWAGTIKCSGVSENEPPFSGTPSATMSIYEDNRVVVYAGWIAPYVIHTSMYFPDPGDPNKGIFGFTAVGAPDGDAYSETGQARLERKKDGKVMLDGKSYALSALIPFDVVSAMCEWKFNKTSDTPSPPPPA